jgi:hypothetical protein
MDCDDAVAQQDEDCADAVALEDGRCIMVETNFRVYAYTSSTLQEQILRLFTQVTMRIRTHDSRRLVSGSDVNCGPREQVQYKFPNLVISLITRSSVRNALKVAAQQAVACAAPCSFRRLLLDLALCRAGGNQCRTDHRIPQRARAPAGASYCPCHRPFREEARDPKLVVASTLLPAP